MHQIPALSTNCLSIGHIAGVLVATSDIPRLQSQPGEGAFFEAIPRIRFPSVPDGRHQEEVAGRAVIGMMIDEASGIRKSKTARRKLGGCFLGAFSSAASLAARPARTQGLRW